MAKITARHIARHGLPPRYIVTVRSPYTGKVCTVVAAKEHGSRVTLTLESGYELFVPAVQEVFKTRKPKEAKT
jgi:hypothetical protein